MGVFTAYISADLHCSVAVIILLKVSIVYKQNIHQSLSQLTLTALFTKESLAVRLVYNADLQLNKRIKASLFY